MTNTIPLLLLSLTGCALVAGVLFAVRRRKKNQPPKTHGPHTPGAGYDQKEIARSKGNGMYDSGSG